MENIDPQLNQRLQQLGLAADDLPRFLQDVARSISAQPAVGLAALNRKLEAWGWRGAALDAATLELIQRQFADVGMSPPAVEDIIRDPEGLQQLLEKIYRERGFDFRGYSKTSLNRRIQRRLQARGVETFSAYSRVLNDDPKEYEHLFNEMLVRVTRFFRNKTAFQALSRVLSDSAAAAGPESRPFRIWSAGCATGEEPYTIAMLAENLADEHPALAEVAIVATDIDGDALRMAATACYAPDALQDLPPGWLETFFSQSSRGFQVNPEIRKRVAFSLHNLVNEPPYEDVDIVVCRNVLIYFEPGLQMKVIQKFLNALKPGGHLLLGRYEMLLKHSRNRFACVDFDARLYRKKR